MRRIKRWHAAYAGSATGVALVALLAAGVAGRPGPAGRRAEPATAPGGIARYQQTLRDSPGDYRTWANLGAAYVQQARTTVDPTYYPKAEGALRRSLALNPADDYRAMIGMAALANARHDFAGAARWGEKAKRIDASAPDVFGTLNDAYTQLGDYPAATRAVRRMVILQPGVASFTRASYDLEQHGDVAGARKLLVQAAGAAYTPSDVAYCRYYLGELAFHGGDLTEAAEQYGLARAADGTYAPALEGLAKTEALRGDTAGALRDFEAVVGRVPQPQYVMEYAEYLTAQGRPAEAAKQRAVLDGEQRLFAVNGVTDDLTAAEYAADTGDAVGALNHARAGVAPPPQRHRRRRPRLGPAPERQEHRSPRLREAGHPPGLAKRPVLPPQVRHRIRPRRPHGRTSGPPNRRRDQPTPRPAHPRDRQTVMKPHSAAVAVVGGAVAAAPARSGRPSVRRPFVVAVARRLAAIAVLVVAAGGGCAAGAGAAVPAHPLGNFTVNHYDGLVLYPDRVTDTAIVDAAEIPTLQEQGAVDTGHDGAVSAAEADAFARTGCAGLVRAASVTVAGRPLAWSVVSSSYVYVPGSAGLRTSRLTCGLTARVSLTRPAVVAFANGFRADRVGWHEITATGHGVRLDSSPVPQHSVSDELRRYPGDLLTSPLNVRSATLRTAPGAGSSVRDLPVLPSAGVFSRSLNRLTGYFDDLVGARHLTLPIGLLALLLSVVLGASHAAMPGHGKTVMAAYIAGRRGRVRDAVTVGLTVTVTHTGGVLILGLLLSASASLAGESLLSGLGVISGLLVTAIGLGLLRSAWRSRSTPTPFEQATAGPEPVTTGTDHAPAATLHTHPGPLEAHSHAAVATLEHDPRTHSHTHGRGHSHGEGRFGRGGLIGLGISGGLVPSPSALVVLLGAIALGRTAFGVALVLGYGAGMAATLTAAGLLLVRLRGVLARVPLGRRASRLTRYTPALTAALVTVVGLGLALRSLTGSV